MRHLVVLFLLFLIPSMGVAQCPNTSMRFDGSDDTVSVADSPVLDGFGDFTIEMWFQAADQGVMLQKGPGTSSTDTAYSIVYKTNPGLGTAIVTFNSVVTASRVVLDDGEWHHFAVSRSGGNTASYLDGVGGVNGFPANTTLPIPDISNALRIGGDPTTYLGIVFGIMDGGLDEIRIWSVGRTAAEIQSTMSAPLLGNEPGLVAYYDFEHGTGQTVFDRTARLNDGALGTTTLGEGSDPFWSSTSPILGCQPINPGTGAANSIDASLEFGGHPRAFAPGPFAVALDPGQNFTLEFHGHPGQPFVLFGSPVMNPANTTVLGLGSVDIGTPPNFGDVSILLDGTSSSASPFHLDGFGAASLNYTLPPGLPAGPIIAIQGAVVQPPPLGGGFWIRTTAAHTIVVR